ncbi:hypothetical protein TrRE_jg7563 [Triparma retinervis]|uniref:Uncharacterized protein n=1 Tax=Triparma retinervis TaxID=2557542 RepID=A0A9W7DZL7_9STRA|nr:hypothetical protein TrRE_jg7563 [Triparma retinervis]
MGNETSEDDAVQPIIMFIVVRSFELLLEVMPETVLQLYANLHAEDISSLATVSIFSSIASAAFIMMDSSILFERHVMNQQIRGPYSHPIIGFIPTDGYHNAAIQLGMMLAYGGYLTCGMMTISAALTVINWGYIFLVICCEFALFLGLQASRGRLNFMLEAPGGKNISIISHIMFYLMLSFCPWAHVRIDNGGVGGGMFAFALIYRILSNTAIFIFATSQFETESTRAYFFASFLATITGATLILSYVQREYRWTFYSSRWKWDAFMKWSFNASELIFDAETQDQQRSLERYASYNDAKGFAQVKFHLDKLKKEVDERKLVENLSSIHEKHLVWRQRRTTNNGNDQQLGIRSRKDAQKIEQLQELIIDRDYMILERDQIIAANHKAIVSFKDENAKLKILLRQRLADDFKTTSRKSSGKLRDEFL